jgi:hypothetical protein
MSWLVQTSTEGVQDEEARLLRTRAEHGQENGWTRGSTEGRCAGYELQDPLGRRVGLVEQIFADSVGIPKCVAVRQGFFKRRPLLIPVRAIAVNDERRTVVLR